LYADDLKNFNIINAYTDCDTLQLNIESIENWCKNNKLALNINKCKVMTFSRKANPVLYNYSIDGQLLERCEKIIDLGVYFDCKLTFNAHIEYITNHCYNLLRFLTRNTVSFDSNVLKTFYNAFIRSKLEYCFIVWSPTYQKYIHMLEAVQRKFLKTLYYRRHHEYLAHGYCYNNLLNEFDYISINDRRTLGQIIFVCKIINNSISDENLLSSLNFNVPRLNSRTTLTFYLPCVNTRHYANGPLVEMCRKVNTYCCNVDIFCLLLGFVYVSGVVYFVFKIADKQ
jgi:hypothetical protein